MFKPVLIISTLLLVIIVRQPCNCELESAESSFSESVETESEEVVKDNKPLKSYKFIVSISKDNYQLGILGTGVLISRNFVVTTAQIVSSQEKTLNSDEMLIHYANGNYGKIDSIFVHEYFINRTLRNNIALLRLKKKAPSDIVPADLHNTKCGGNTETSEIFKKCKIVSEPEVPHDDQAANNIRLVDINNCTQRHDDKKLKLSKDSHICSSVVLSESVNVGCGNASRGSLLLCESGGKEEICGLMMTAYNTHLCGNKNPAIYVKIEKYVKWINKIMNPKENIKDAKLKTEHDHESGAKIPNLMSAPFLIMTSIFLMYSLF